ncbi:MAG: ImmA/IrrE family metallo-endopeptidase [Polyangiaceae bacterium]|nr:ImmA/IrrE family metallo-endopeptidase [Polyangiaceae bacterium]
MVNASRIRQARELRGLTQSALADRVGVRQPAISQFEAGLAQPEDATLEAIANATRFPTAFFQQDAPAEFPAGTLLFRARLAMTQREEREIYQLAAIAFEIAVALRLRTTAIPARVPRLAIPPEDAAIAARTLLGLNPHGPVLNVVDALERAGVLVIALPSALPKRDAFATWAGPDLGTPVIVLCPTEAGDRLRFSAAHELGHLVLHSGTRAPEGGLRSLELEANAFAGAFMLPADDFRVEVLALGGVNLDTLARLKSRWGVSIQAMVTRAKDIGLINEEQRKYLFQQIVRRGWKRIEPVFVPPEKPRAMRKMAELLYRNPPDLGRLAADHRLPEEYVSQLLKGYATAVEMPPRAVVSRAPAARSRVVRFAAPKDKPRR